MILRLLTILIFWRRVIRRVLHRPRTIYVGDRVVEYRDLWWAAARAIEADFDELAPAVWEVRSGTLRTRISNDLVEFDDPVVLDLAGDKSFCYELARGLGVPTPRPLTFAKEELARAIERFPLDRGPYVVKPAKGTGSGVGVSVGVRSRFELANAVALASVHSKRIIIERLVAAETVRLLFLDGRMIHAVRRRGVRVEPDGITSVEQLLARHTPRPVPIDALVRETLRQQGRSLADVPPPGESLVVRWLPAEIESSRELRTVYDEEVTNLVSPVLVDEVASLLAALGSRFAGVDLLTNDPSRSLAESGGVFLEINTTPGLHHHCNPSPDGVACHVAVTVLRRLLDRDAT
jgi:D-alanine-D-alanine ligase-like ATP-grasp enzyme